MDQQPLEDPTEISDLFAVLIKKNLPVVMAFEVREKGEPVTARGTCGIKELRDGLMVFHQFRHSLFLKGLKKGLTVKVYFPDKRESRETSAVVQEVTDREITVPIPDKLYSVKDIRIQPRQDNPVSLFVLIPDEPTTNHRVIDISPRGIGFLCARDLPVGGRFSFTIMLPDPQAVVAAHGIIRHKRGLSSGYQYGVELMLHPWDADNIARYVMKRELEIIGLLRGY